MSIEESKPTEQTSLAQVFEAEHMSSGDVEARAQSLEKLRAFTDQLEESIEKAKNEKGRKAIRPDPKLLMEISEQMPSAIESIRCALSDMTSLSNGMRTLNYLASRPLMFEPLECVSIVDELLRSNNLFIETNRVTVNVGRLDDVAADKQSIQDILQGLFDNALKYLDPVRQGSISLSSHRDINFTTFIVADNGRGICEEDNMFDVFKRSEEVVHISGEGMGLPYVQTLVRRHNGALWYQSEYGVGTTFYFTVDNHLTPTAERKNER